MGMREAIGKGAVFMVPVTGDAQGKVVLSHEELHLLIGGIDLAQTQARDWYREATNEELPPLSVIHVVLSCGFPASSLTE